jgi:signal transduction histidine kinase/ligand-binding sensor domain-containing protein
LIRYILLFFALVQYALSGAQQFVIPNSKVPFKTIKNSSGLSSKFVNACVQDKNGFIWLATLEGLNRYDGKMCKSFTKVRGQSNTLTSNEISDIKTDSKGNLWLSTRDAGLNCLDLTTFKFKHFINDPKDPSSLGKNGIYKIFFDKDENLWSIPLDWSGLIFLPKNDSKFISFSSNEKDKNSLVGNFVRTVLSLKDGQVWIIAINGLCSFNPSKRNFNRVPLPDELKLIHSADIYDDNKILLFTNNGLYFFNAKSRKFDQPEFLKKINIQEGRANRIFVDSKKNIWIGTFDNGLLYIRADYDHTIHFTEDFSNENALKKNDIREIYEDREGNIWICTYGGGASYINSSFKSFNHYNYSGTLQNQLSHNVILSFAQTGKDKILISTDGGGMFEFNKSLGVFKSLNKDENTKVVLSQISDSSGNVWMGNFRTGLLKFNPNSKTYKQFLFSNFQIFNRSWQPSIYVMAWVKDKLWLGTNGQGIIIFDPKTEKYQKSILPETDTAKGKGPLNGFIRSIYFDGNNKVWIGHYRGLSICNINNYSFDHIEISKLDTSLLGNTCAFTILKDSYGNMWVGTGGQGLLLVDPENKSHRFFDQYNGLNATQVYGIIEDKFKNIWLSTNNGLIKFKISEKNPKHLAFTSFYEESGLQGNVFNSGSYFKDKDGLLYFGGGNGFNVFFPEIFNAEEKIANGIQISDLKIFGISQIPGDSGSILTQSINSLKELKLEYRLYNFSLSFVSPYYSGYGKVTYRYKLQGIDNKWTLADNSLTANYSHIPPGIYYFQIQASLNGTDWITREPLKIIISPPWWKIWWVRLIIGLIVIVLLLTFYYARINILKAQKNILEETVNIRTGEIVQKNVQLNEQKEEIASQNEILEKQKFELTKNYYELKNTLTELENARNALIESEKMASLGILTAGVAHEINNPLNFITLGIDNIKNVLNEIQQQNNTINNQTFEQLNILITHSETGIRRISDIIDSLRTYSHSGDSEPQKIQMKDLINSSIIILKSKIPDFINLVYNFEDIEMISCKPNQISQVIINIVDNAIDSIQSKKEKANEYIKFSLTKDKIQQLDYLSLEIENSGPPVPENIMKKIFDPFFTTKAPKEGSGLGLYISYNIIKDHKGFLKVINQNNHVVFKLLLPYSSINN